MSENTIRTWSVVLSVVAVVALSACGGSSKNRSVMDDDMTTDDMTADDMTTDDMTADDMTTDDMTADDMTTDDMTADDMTADDMTTDDTTADDMTTDDMTADDMTADDMTTDDMTADDMTTDDMTADDMTADDMDMVDLGYWSDERPGGVAGFSNMTLGLSATYNLSTGIPSISASSPGQPTISGTWEGEYAVNYGITNDADEIGDAMVEVTIQGGDVSAVVTYRSLAILGGADAATNSASVDANGRFTPTGSIHLPSIGTVTYSGAGQFGGAEQRGVVGHIGGHANFRSVFYGTREEDDSN